MRRVLLVLLVAGCLLGVLALTTGPVPRAGLERFTELANALAFRLGGYRLSDADAEDWPTSRCSSRSVRQVRCSRAGTPPGW